jgi:uncharacterized protein YaiI (UPF0178 family)
MQVDDGLNVADNQIVQKLQHGDLVITADIPLAAEVIEDNVGERLAVRNLMDELRSGGLDTGGPSSFSQSDRQAFANQLDRFLAKHGNT